MNAIGPGRLTRQAVRLVVLLPAVFLLKPATAAPTSGELKLRRDWAAQHLAGKAAAFPFTFTYGGRSASELLPSWKLERQRPIPQPGRTQRTLTCTDPATGLRVRCDVTEYDDFPAVEWVLHFENGGTQDTPILEKVLPLAVELKGRADANVVVHHSVGEKNSAQSFAPVENELAPRSTNELVLAPIGGRSSDGCMPFFNLAWPEGGAALAVGWSGQWEARFRRSARGGLRGAGRPAACALQAASGRKHPHAADSARLLAGQRADARQQPLPPGPDGPLSAAPQGRAGPVPNLRQRQLGRPGRFLRGAAHQRDAAAGPARHRGLLVGHGPATVVSEGLPRRHRHLGARPGQVSPRAQAHRRRRPRGRARTTCSGSSPSASTPARRIDREHPEWVMPPQKEWSKLFRLHDEQARRWLTDYIDAQISAAPARLAALGLQHRAARLLAPQRRARPPGHHRNPAHRRASTPCGTSCGRGIRGW